MSLAIRIALVTLLGATFVGCAGQNYRPCGPGYLNNALVPQGFAGVDMRPACQNHDDCYGMPCSDRRCCDDVFLEEMDARCECSQRPRLCRLKARQWYWMTRLYGASAYRISQRDSQGCDACECQ